MKRFAFCLLFGLTLMVSGCGGSTGEGTNVVQDADAKAKADYEAAIAAQEAESDAAEMGDKPAAE